MEELDATLFVINFLLWVFFLISLAIYKKTESPIAKYISYALAILSVVGLILLLSGLNLSPQSLLVPLIKNSNFL